MLLSKMWEWLGDVSLFIHYNFPFLNTRSITFDSQEGGESKQDDIATPPGVYSVQFPSEEIQTRERGRREGGGHQQPRRRRLEPSLVVALGKSFIGTLAAAAFFKLWQDLLSFVSPQLLK